MEHCGDHDVCMKDIRAALFGPDGDTEKGVVFKTTQAVLAIQSLSTQITKHREIDKRDIEEIKNSLNGTMDKKGLKTIVMEHEDFIKPQRESINGFINWIYKGMMVAGMITVLYLLGFKHF